MLNPGVGRKADYILFGSMIFLITLSLFILNSIAPFLFPGYLVYILVGAVAFWLFYHLDFEIISLFSNHAYIASIFFLLLTIAIGQVTRGTLRWIPIGSISLQPAELTRPFLLLFFANYLTFKELTLPRLIRAALLLALPVVLIVIQPSLSVGILTTIGVGGVLLATSIKKRYLVLALALVVLLMPLTFLVLAPYQRLRIETFLNPGSDPLGAGYNSLQSKISVGSGQLFGRGLGKGIGTQLFFLPERHTDFIFASISEELGFIGAFLVIGTLFVLLFRLTKLTENPRTSAGRAFVSGLVLVLFVQSLIHIGMNLGLLPVTGVPLPLVSAGGSSFLATMIALSIALGVKRS